MPGLRRSGAVLRRVLAYALPYRWSMAASCALMVAASGVALLPAQLNRALIDGVLLPRHDLPLLGFLVLGLLGVQLVQRAVGVAQGRIGNRLGNRIVGDIRSQLWAHIQALSLAYFDQAQIGNLLARVTRDTARVQGFLTSTIQQFVIQGLQLVGVLTVMLIMNWRLTLIALVPAPLALGVSTLLWPYVRRMDRRLWQTVARLNVVVSDALAGMRVVKAFGQERREVERFAAANAELVGRSVTVANLWTTFGPAFAFVAGLGTLLVWCFGGRLLGGRAMELGTLIAVTSYLGLVLRPVNWGGQLVTAATAALTSAERVFEVLDAEPEVREPAHPVPMPCMRGEVRFEGVDFGYSPTYRCSTALTSRSGPERRSASSGIPVPASARSSTFCVGSTTCGPAESPSTAWTCAASRFPIGGDRWGSCCRTRSSSTAAIAENIGYGRPGADLWDVMVAAEAANAHDFICARPDGYETRVGERGQRLSGGERRRIAIARAVLHDPRLLILDEATAALDGEAERHVQEAIGRLVQGRTTFAIAHRLSTLRRGTGWWCCRAASSRRAPTKSCCGVEVPTRSRCAPSRRRWRAGR